jgi:ADP-ribose pyrophosphatase YjhB (NUDIX family)
MPNAMPQAHAYIAVDVVILTIAEGLLEALVVQVRDGPFAGRWAFPGGLVGVGESLEEVAVRELNASGRREDVYLEQLYTFGEPDRDPRARVVSTAYLALVPDPDLVGAGEKYAAAAWYPVSALPPLAYDHDDMARYALERLRAKLAYTNIVYGLLPTEFTLSDLQAACEIILGRELDRRNFRKKLLTTGLLLPLVRQRRGAHRPATLYRFARREPMVIDIL